MTGCSSLQRFVYSCTNSSQCLLAFHTLVELEDHPTRAAILAQLKAHPGIHFRELERSTGLAIGQLMHHVRRLESAQLLHARTHRGQKLLFEHPPSDEEWLRLLFQKEDVRSKLLMEAIVNGVHLDRDLQREFPNFPRTSRRFTLARLAQVGLIQEVQGAWLPSEWLANNWDKLQDS